MTDANSFLSGNNTYNVSNNIVVNQGVKSTHYQTESNHNGIHNNGSQEQEQEQYDINLSSVDLFDDSQPLESSIVGPADITLRDSEYCKYTYDSKNNIVEVKVLKTPNKDSTDNITIMQLMELDDIALILDNLNKPRCISYNDLLDGDKRSFDVKMYRINKDCTAIETKDKITMNVVDFKRYLTKHEDFAKAKREGKGVPNNSVS